MVGQLILPVQPYSLTPIKLMGKWKQFGRQYMSSVPAYGAASAIAYQAGQYLWNRLRNRVPRLNLGSVPAPVAEQSLRKEASMVKRFYSKRRRVSRFRKRRRTYRGRRVRTRTMVAPVRRNRLSFKTDSKHTHLVRDPARATTSATANIAAYQEYSPITPTTIANAIANIRYFNAAAPATADVANKDAATFSDRMTIVTEGKIVLKNNYKQDVKVLLMVCCPRSDTTISPDTSRTNGLTDQQNPTAAHVMLYPQMSTQFQALWYVKKKSYKVLKPGELIEMRVPKQAFVFDPAEKDQHSFTYQKIWKSWVWYIRVEGAVVHDAATSSNIGQGYATVEGYYDTKFKLYYNGGASFNDYTVENNMASVTGSTAVAGGWNAELETYS